MLFRSVTVDDNKGHTKIVTVNTDTMEANMVPEEEAVVGKVPAAEPAIVQTLNGVNVGGGKRPTPSFRLKKRRITRKLKKTR